MDRDFDTFLRALSRKDVTTVSSMCQRYQINPDGMVAEVILILMGEE